MNPMNTLCRFLLWAIALPLASLALCAAAVAADVVLAHRRYRRGAE